MLSASKLRQVKITEKYIAQETWNKFWYETVCCSWYAERHAVSEESAVRILYALEKAGDAYWSQPASSEEYSTWIEETVEVTGERESPTWERIISRLGRQPSRASSCPAGPSSLQPNKIWKLPQ